MTILPCMIRRRDTLRCLPDYSVSSLTELLGDIVTLINDKVLVEHFEDLTALKICHLVATTLFAGPGDDRSKVALRIDV